MNAKKYEARFAALATLREHFVANLTALHQKCQKEIISVTVQIALAKAPSSEKVVIANSNEKMKMAA